MPRLLSTMRHTTHSPLTFRPSTGAKRIGSGFALFVPILYAVLGFIGGVISAAVYNLATKWVGGIELEVE